MSLITNPESHLIEQKEESVIVSEEVRKAIDLLFSNLIIVTKYKDYYIAKDLLIHLAEQGSSEKEAIDNLMNMIEEHLIAIKKIMLEREEFKKSDDEMILN